MMFVRDTPVLFICGTLEEALPYLALFSCTQLLRVHVSYRLVFCNER